MGMDYFRLARLPHATAWERALVQLDKVATLAYVDWRDKPGPTSLQTQGIHGIDARGMTGRQPARRSCGQNQNERGHSEAKGVQSADLKEQARHKPGKQTCREQSDRQSHCHRSHSVLKNQPGNVQPVGAERDSHSDLFAALQDRIRHDTINSIRLAGSSSLSSGVTHSRSRPFLFSMRTSVLTARLSLARRYAASRCSPRSFNSFSPFAWRPSVLQTAGRAWVHAPPCNSLARGSPQRSLPSRKISRRCKPSCNLSRVQRV